MFSATAAAKIKLSRVVSWPRAAELPYTPFGLWARFSHWWLWLFSSAGSEEWSEVTRWCPNSWRPSTLYRNIRSGIFGQGTEFELPTRLYVMTACPSKPVRTGIMDREVYGTAIHKSRKIEYDWRTWHAKNRNVFAIKICQNALLSGLGISINYFYIIDMLPAKSWTLNAKIS